MSNAKVRYRLNAKIEVEVEGASVKDVITALSEYTEVFQDSACGSCGSTEVAPAHRSAQGYDFYEIACHACGAKLSFGQTREGGHLFPKRKDQDGNEIGKNGWHIYRQQAQQSQQSDNWGEV